MSVNIHGSQCTWLMLCRVRFRVRIRVRREHLSFQTTLAYFHCISGNIVIIGKLPQCHLFGENRCIKQQLLIVHTAAVYTASHVMLSNSNVHTANHVCSIAHCFFT